MSDAIAGPLTQGVVELNWASECHYWRGHSNNYQYCGPMIPGQAIVSDTSSIPQTDVGNLGLCNT